MKKLFILLAAAMMAAGCNQNPPSVGGTGTITPVDDPTEPIEPSDGMRISYVRNDSLAYTFTGSNFPILRLYNGISSIRGWQNRIKSERDNMSLLIILSKRLEKLVSL